MEIRYLSHGKNETGGYRHGLFFAQQLQLRIQGSRLAVLRNPEIFRGWNHFRLQFWGCNKSKGDIIIVSVRLALIAIIRNLFTKRKIFIIMHNFDKTDGKTLGLKCYYYLLFLLLKINPSSRIRVVTDSPFFKDKFQNKIKEPIILFPNFFDTKKLQTFKKEKKKRKIHLGQWSEKNSPQIFVLAEKLTAQKFECYFSTLISNLSQSNNTYSVVNFQTYEDYLEEMSECMYTLALPSVNEGWNRVAHESILVGTTVIGFEKGGLGYLLHEASMFVVIDAEAAYDLILKDNHPIPKSEFIHKYDISQAAVIIDGIIN